MRGRSLAGQQSIRIIAGVICLLSEYVTLCQYACWNILPRGGLWEQQQDHPSRLNLPQRQRKMKSIHLDCLFVRSDDSYSDQACESHPITVAVSQICQQRQQ